MLVYAKQIADELITEFVAYKNEYAELEDANDFILPSCEMDDFIDALGNHRLDASNVCEKVNFLLKKIDEPAWSSGETYTDNIKCMMTDTSNNIQKFRSEVKGIETTTVNRMVHLESKIRAFKSCVESIGAGSYGTPKDYKKGSFLKSYAYTQLVTTANAQNTLHVVLTYEEIATLEGLGYSAEDIKTILAACETEEDQKFVLHMADGSNGYEGMFYIDPNKLSEQIKCILVDYTARLLEIDPNGKFIDMNNELLGAENLYNDKGDTYRDLFLDILSYYSLVVLVDAGITTGMDTDWETLCKAADIWNTENGLVDILTNNFDEEFNCHSFSVDGITEDMLGNSHLQISFYSPSDLGRINSDVEIITELWPDDVDSKIMAVDAAERERSRSVAAIVKDILEDFINNRVGTITGNFPKLLKQVQYIINKLNGYAANSAAMDSEDLKDFYKYFGMGTYFNVTAEGGYTIIDKLGIGVDNVAYMGLYNIDVLEKMAEWEENGLSWYWQDEAKKKEFLEVIKDARKNMEPPSDDEFWTWECIEALAGGGYDFSNMDWAEFTASIEELNRILEDNHYMNVNTAWIQYVCPNSRE